MDSDLDDTRHNKMASTAWHKRLEAVTTLEDILETVRDYLAQITPDALARLPERCRPGRIKFEDDIDHWTFRLGQQHKEEPCDAELLQEIFNHFLHASHRISELRKKD